jgi:hypothetical protein
MLGVLLFASDMLVFLTAMLVRKKKLSKAEVNKTKAWISYVIPIELFIQVFFALVLMYTYHFLMAFNIVSRDLVGGFSYAFIFFVPMLYLLFNSWLWGDREFGEKLLPSIISWLIKFILAGTYLGLMS